MIFMFKIQYVRLIVICFLCAMHSLCAYESRKIAIVGTGYVGLITGCCLARIGHSVVCVDIDQKKIDGLNNGIIPLFEPGLEEIFEKNIALGAIRFTTDAGKAIQDADIVMVAVGTPPGEAQLSYLKSAIQTIALNLNTYKVICIKSTVPVGTHARVKSWLEEYASSLVDYDLISNPEFLREGSALSDFFSMNPIVLGGVSEKAFLIMEDLYKPLLEQGIALFRTDYASAEMIKYASNAFFALRISYANELSRLCNKTGADIGTIIAAMSTIARLLPNESLKPGPGIGGSCLLKDVGALINIADELDVNANMVRSIRDADVAQRNYIMSLLLEQIGLLEGKTIAILGLSFKANTNDVRESAAINIMLRLLREGARIQAYDPQAMRDMKEIVPEAEYCGSMIEAMRGADALLILTEWDEFRHMNLCHIKQYMHTPLVIDARNILDPQDAGNCGIQLINLGRR